jgi:hypothetical protein
VTSKLQLRRAHCVAGHRAILSHANFHLHFVVATVAHEDCVELLNEVVQFLEAPGEEERPPSAGEEERTPVVGEDAPRLWREGRRGAAREKEEPAAPRQVPTPYASCVFCECKKNDDLVCSVGSGLDGGYMGASHAVTC